MSGLTVVRFGVDTLEFTFKGELSVEVVDALAKAKEQAALADAPVPFTVAGEELFVLPKGRGLYAYVLQRGDLIIRLTESRSVPTASVHLGAYGLAVSGPEMLYAWAERFCAELGASSAFSLSRIDLALDFQGFEPTHEDIRGMVCPASKRAEFYGGDRLETASWGKRPIMMRVYDKTQQIREEHKEWWETVWAACPAYDPAKRVYRCEAEITRAVLKELGVLSVASALEDPGRLLQYAMHWCELRIPSADQTKARWRVDPRWELLLHAVYSAKPCSRARLKTVTIADEALMRRFLGLVETYAARWGRKGYWQALETLSIDALNYLDSEELDFEAETEKRRRRLLAE